MNITFADLIDLYLSIIKINTITFQRLIDNLDSDDYCSRKETAIKAAAWDLIDEKLTNYIRKEKE